MESESFGLAKIKQEGKTLSYDTQATFKPLKFRKPNSETRWIELCYDPKEDTSKINALTETIAQLIDSNLLSSQSPLTEDDCYLLIKTLANKYIPEGGF